MIGALLRTIQATAIDVALELEGFAPEKSKVRVRLNARVAGNGLDVRDVGGGRYTLALDVTSVVFDLAGKPVFVGSDHASSILGAEDAEAARQGAALRYPVPLAPLAPGVYQARVAVYEQATRRVGARSLWFVVPNVKK